LRTKRGFIVIDNDKEIVEKRVQQISKVIPEERVGEFVIHGTPEDVLKQIELLEEVGIQYLIVDLEPYRELEALEMFGNSIIKKMSRTANAAH
jgi:hypothetical protein